MHPSPRFRRIPPALIGSGTIFLLAGALCVALLLRIQPEVTGGAYRLSADGEWIAFTPPWESSAQSAELHVALTVLRGFPSATRFSFTVDDCLEAAWINGTPVPLAGLDTSCVRNPTLHLAEVLRPGENTFRFLVRNAGGPAGLTMRVAASDPLLRSLQSAVLLLLVGFAIVVSRTLRFSPWQNALLGAVLLGVLLRVGYFFATSFLERGYDAAEHAAYIRFVLENWTVPPSGWGWEFYQPPLYYFLCAAYWKFLSVLGWGNRMFAALQFPALALSLGAFGVAGLTFSRVFRGARERLPLFAALLFLAALPGLVFFAARINNDTLVFFWAVAALFFLVRWWQRGVRADGIGAAVMICLAMLTKTSGALLIPALLCAFFLRPGDAWRKKLSLACQVLLLIALFTGWYYALRFWLQGDQSAFPNVANLNSGLRVPLSLSAFTTFHPGRLVEIPFNDSWSDAARREYFWEFLFRSALSGEFAHPPGLRPLGSVLVASALFLIPYLLSGFLHAFAEWKRFAPFLLVFAFPMAGQISIRFLYSFSTAADVRHASVILVPLACFLGLGVARAPALLRRAGACVLVAFAASASAFLLALS